MSKQTIDVAVHRILIDPSSPGEAFPRLHEGRYEVDPVGNQSYPVPALLKENAKRCGLKLLRCGVGIWLPSQDPDPAGVASRDWFGGETMADTADASQYNWAHLDKVIETCSELGCDLLLSFDWMPTSLANRKPFTGIPDPFKAFAVGYQYPDGIRTAPPKDPEIFAAACVHLVREIENRGVKVRYVELGNEPDLPFWWSGTFDEFWSMYAAFARAMRTAGYIVGGPSWASLIGKELWRDEFIARAAREGVPLDFYSWHRYPTKPQRVMEAAREIRDALDSAGLSETESVIDEWGFDLSQHLFWGTTAMAAFMAECIVGFAGLGMKAQLGGLLVDPVPVGGPAGLGLFDRAGNPNPVFFCFEAFERFQDTPRRLPLEGWRAAVAGTDGSGQNLGLILANATEEPKTFEISLGRHHGTGIFKLLDQPGYDERRDWRAPEEWRIGDEPFALTLPQGSIATFLGKFTTDVKQG